MAATILAVWLGRVAAEPGPGFLYCDNFVDFSQWGRDATGRRGTTAFTSCDFRGSIGAQGFGTWGSLRGRSVGGVRRQAASVRQVQALPRQPETAGQRPSRCEHFAPQTQRDAHCSPRAVGPPVQGPAPRSAGCSREPLRIPGSKLWGMRAAGALLSSAPARAPVQLRAQGVSRCPSTAGRLAPLVVV